MGTKSFQTPSSDARLRGFVADRAQFDANDAMSETEMADDLHDRFSVDSCIRQIGDGTVPEVVEHKIHDLLLLAKLLDGLEGLGVVISRAPCLFEKIAGV
jgi:hypothetical protein